MGLIIIITGGRGDGKTTACQRRITEARVAGLAVAGVVCPGRFANGLKTGIYAEDLCSGERRLLASSQPDEITGGEPFRRWVFDPQVLAWGNSLFTEAAPCDLLVVDELGPLELLENKGWQAALVVLNQGEYNEAWVVVRSELVDVFLVSFPATAVWNVGLDHKISPR